MSRGGSAPLSVGAFLLFGLLSAAVMFPLDGRGPTDDKATTAQVSNANVRPVVVELFTSEGCSSCPPADALLQTMDTSQPVPVAQLIVLSEHVDYWDHDGWKDPNSSSALTERQSDYVRALGLKTAYTPQFIVDGTREMHIGDPQQMDKVLQDAAAVPKVLVRIDAVTIDAASPTVLRAHIEADSGSDKHNANVFVAVALDHVESQVLHGENGGRRLTHVAVVLQLTKIGKLQEERNFSQNIQLKLKSGTDPRNIRLIAFVQESGAGRIVGAALRKSVS
jgi:hypothetical protein